MSAGIFEVSITSGYAALLSTFCFGWERREASENNKEVSTATVTTNITVECDSNDLTRGT
jgi:hypothetical protein